MIGDRAVLVGLILVTCVFLLFFGRSGGRKWDFIHAFMFIYIFYILHILPPIDIDKQLLRSASFVSWCQGVNNAGC